MAKFVAISDAVKSLSEVESRFGIRRNAEADFFGEWQADLPELSAADQSALARMGERLAYHRGEGELLEGAVMLLAVSPLLEVAGLYDPPFRMRAEAAVELAIDDGEEVLRGRIDVLILQGALWVLVVEAKKTMISARSALPQALAYMMTGTGVLPRFGMVTNGDDVVFVKLGVEREYGLSRSFSLYTVGSEVELAVRVLRRLGAIVASKGSVNVVGESLR
jgi:hypothetical protein